MCYFWIVEWRSTTAKATANNDGSSCSEWLCLLSSHLTMTCPTFIVDHITYIINNASHDITALIDNTNVTLVTVARGGGDGAAVVCTLPSPSPALSLISSTTMTNQPSGPNTVEVPPLPATPSMVNVCPLLPANSPLFSPVRLTTLTPTFMRYIRRRGRVERMTDR
jgi:hypothetical protein